MSSIKLTPVEQPSGGIEHVTALLPPLEQRYQRRAKRLRQLADGHAMSDYLLFAAGIAQAQQQVLDTLPLPASANAQVNVTPGDAPLHHAQLPRAPYWRAALASLITQLQPQASSAVRNVLDELQASTPERLEELAGHLLAGRFAEVGSGHALFLWSALSLYWTQLAASLQVRAEADFGEQRQFCPVCASAPAASVILGGDKGGLRYLHCGLCESRWHMVRIKCSNCEQDGKLNYWSLENKEASVKAESCTHCDSYLKQIYLDRDDKLEVFADDLATLALDAEVEREGFARSGLNPFLFPG